MAIYDCYHGTSKASADKILKERRFKAKERDDHWLGQGVYFFINDFDNAKWWSQLHRQQGAVVYCQLSIPARNLLDLDTDAGSKKVDKFVNKIVRSLTNSGKLTLEDVKDHVFQCRMLDLYASYSPKCWAIKYTFSRQRCNSIGLHLASPQLCVKNQDKLELSKLSITREAIL